MLQEKKDRCLNTKEQVEEPPVEQENIDIQEKQQEEEYTASEDGYEFEKIEPTHAYESKTKETTVMTLPAISGSKASDSAGWSPGSMSRPALSGSKVVSEVSESRSSGSMLSTPMPEAMTSFDLEDLEVLKACFSLIDKKNHGSVTLKQILWSLSPTGQVKKLVKNNSRLSELLIPKLIKEIFEANTIDGTITEDHFLTLLMSSIAQTGPRRTATTATAVVEEEEEEEEEDEYNDFDDFEDD